MADRRTLEFARLDEVMPEVDRLLAGHATVGNWTLGQICNHLASTYRMSMEGFGVQMPWLFRATLGRVFKKKIFAERRMKAGIKVPGRFLPQPGLDDRGRETEAALRASIAYYTRSHPSSPGPCTRSSAG